MGRWPTVLLLLLSCSSGTSTSDGGSTDTAVDAGTDLGLPQPEDPISCENACKRTPKCEEDLGTEADCLALCNGQSDPRKYACCIQYADNCASVEKCITKTKLTCKEEGNPWVPLEPFDECECGDPENPTPSYQQCVREGGDTMCDTNLCLKPPSFQNGPFCAVECDATNACPIPWKCVQTPKKNYCKLPFS